MALFSARGWKAYMGSSTELKRIMRFPLSVFVIRLVTGNDAAVSVELSQLPFSPASCTA